MKRARGTTEAGTGRRRPRQRRALPQVVVQKRYSPSGTQDRVLRCGTTRYRGQVEGSGTDWGWDWWARQVMARATPHELFLHWRRLADVCRRWLWRQACYCLLEWIWPSPNRRDDAIEFFDRDYQGKDLHKYMVKKELCVVPWISSTTVIHEGFPHFDRNDAMLKALDSRRDVTKHKYTVEKTLGEIQAEHRRMRNVEVSLTEIRETGRPEYRLMRPSEMGKAWAEKGKRASSHGTDMHYNLECALNGLPHRTDVPEWTLYRMWKAKHPTWRPYRTELCLWDGDWKITGQVDNMWYDTQLEARLADGRPAALRMSDWKFSEQIKESNPYQSGTACFSHDLDDCNREHYGLQQPLYQIMHERHSGGQTVKSRVIVVLHRQQEEDLEFELDFDADRMDRFVAWRYGHLVAYEQRNRYAKLIRNQLQLDLWQKARSLTPIVRDSGASTASGGTIVPRPRDVEILLAHAPMVTHAAFEKLTQQYLGKEASRNSQLFSV